MTTPRKKAAAPKGVDVEKLCQELALGRHDGHLPALMEALGSRIVAVGAKARWRLTLDVPDVGEVSVDEDNVTLLEMEDAERFAGCTWLTLDPRQSARKTRAVLTAALMHRHDMTEADARAALAGVTTLDITASFSEYLTDADPFPAAGPTT